MPIDPEILKKNSEQLDRLARLVSAGVDYDVDLHDGWTAAVAFAHMGFWDRRQAELLRNWEIGDPLPESATDDQLNPVLERYWQQLTPEVTGQMAVYAAREVNEIIESLSDEKVEALLALGKQFMLARGNHREEHIDQIEREL
ncbi:hypothetical protein JYU04_01565 [Dehalococcoides mccartyi]|nr:hypothetical protein [Dehalococcoides mccartyi]